MPSIVTGCSTEAVVIEGPEASENSDNLGASSTVEDTAPTNEAIFNENATLGGQSRGSEAKGILYRISPLQLNLLT